MTDSWWLKVKRAQKHMVEIRREARRYTDSHPYEIALLRQRKRNQNIKRFRLSITEQPNPMLAVMLGDFVHNLRSALDHIVVASVPAARRKTASFPVVFEDIWAQDLAGNYVVPDDDRRSNFRSSVYGLTEEAIMLILRAQPFNLGDQAHGHIFGIISRLENADKHRQLIAVGNGLLNPTLRLMNAGIVEERPLNTEPGRTFLEDGAIFRIWSEPNATSPTAREMDVECYGTAAIIIEVTKLGGNEAPSNWELQETMLNALQRTREFLRLMEPFVRDK